MAMPEMMEKSSYFVIFICLRMASPFGFDVLAGPDFALALAEMMMYSERCQLRRVEEVNVASSRHGGSVETGREGSQSGPSLRRLSSATASPCRARG